MCPDIEESQLEAVARAQMCSSNGQQMDYITDKTMRV